MSTTSSEVSMDDYSTASSKSLHTEALETCTRIAVVGSYSNGSHGKDRFLAHIAETSGQIKDADSILNEFIEKIRHAKYNGLVIEEAVVLTADDNDEDLDDFNRDVISVLQQGIGVNVKVARHSADVKYEMQITENKLICFRPEPVGSEEDEEEEWKTYSEWNGE